MERSHLLPKDHGEYLERIGLNDDDKKVYIATLNSGLVSFGEIQQLTRIDDLATIVDSIRDLIDIGLIRKAKGRMPRYYAILPFMRETLTIEKEFTLALDSMIQSINQNKASVIERQREIAEVGFPEIVKELLDAFYNEIISPLLKEFEEFKDSVSGGTSGFLQNIQGLNTTNKEELDLMISPFMDFTDHLSEKLLDIKKDGIEMLEAKDNTIKEKRKLLLKDVYDKIKLFIDNIHKLTSDFGKTLISSLSKLEDLTGEYKKLAIEFQDLLKQVSKNTRESQLGRMMKEQLELGNNEILSSQVVMVEGVEYIKKADIKNMIKNLDKAINYNAKVELQLNDTLTKSIQLIESAISSTDAAYQDILLSNTNRAAKFKNEINNHGRELSSLLNCLNTEETDVIEEIKQFLVSSILELQEKILMKVSEDIELIKNKKEEVDANYDLQTNKWETILLDQYSRPINIMGPIIENWVDKLKPIVDNFDGKMEAKFLELTESLQNLEEETITTIIDRIRFVKFMVEGRSTDLESILAYSNSFDYVKSSDTWIVNGLPSILASITDMILRSKSKITIVIPNIDFELLELFKKIRSAINITFATDFDVTKDARIITKLQESGRITLRAYGGRDLYGCIRDSEEIIFGYIRENEETVGIRSSTPSVVELLQDRLNEMVIRNSKLVI